MYVRLTFAHPTCWKRLFKSTSNACSAPRMAPSEETAIHKNHFISSPIVTLMPEWKRGHQSSQMLCEHSGNLEIYFTSTSATNSGDTKQHGFTVYPRQRIAALFSDAGGLSAEQRSSYFHRGWRGTYCSRRRGESTTWQEDGGRRGRGGAERGRDHRKGSTTTRPCSRTYRHR